MSYLVLARKFRPQTFASVVGQQHVTRPLANAILRDRVPHALVFTGPRGVGKTSCARVFARALNCSGRELVLTEATDDSAVEKIEPCGECANCLEIAKSTSIAVREVDGASNNSVDNVRELIESLRSLPPPGSKYKIYIIDEVHMLSTAAFNALLKSLEEPPPHTVFIFATTEPHKIPQTVLSRCQRYDFRALTQDAIADQLSFIAEKEGVEIDSAVMKLVARKARGGMRDAQSMFDRLLSFSNKEISLAQAQTLFGIIDSSFFFDLSASIFAHDTAKVLSSLGEVFNQSIDLKTFTSDFVLHWRNILLFSSLKGEKNSEAVSKLLDVTAEDLVQLKEQCAELSPFTAQRLFDVAEGVARESLLSEHPKYVLEAGLIKMATLEDLKPIAELITRLESLEKGGSLAPSRAPSEVISSKPVHYRASQSASAKPTPGKSEKKTPVAEPEVVSNAVASADFNPSWRDFVTHVQSNSELILAAHLRRVTPLEFKTGVLRLSASEFDHDALKERSFNDKLKVLLLSYSSHGQWNIDISIASQQAAENEEEVATSNAQGSLADEEQKQRQERKQRIVAEAKDHPAVKEALDIFKGSKIERVSPLKS